MGFMFWRGRYLDIVPTRKDPTCTSFTLTYIFDDAKGNSSISQTSGNLIVQSGVENTASSSPGTNATLQIGSAVWEFGASIASHIKLNTSPNARADQFVFLTPARNNRVSADIRPAPGGYWPRNGDWRAGFTASSLNDSTGSFSADNDRVSAQGDLAPSAITVIGADLDGQWLGYTTTAGGPGLANWERQWHLAEVSPKGGYVVQQVTRTILGTRPDGAAMMPSSIKYWEAWRVPAGSRVKVPATDNFVNGIPPGSSGSDSVSATARFYEGLTLPSSFAADNSPYAASRLSSASDPILSTRTLLCPYRQKRHFIFKFALGNCGHLRIPISNEKLRYPVFASRAVPLGMALSQAIFISPIVSDI